MNGVSALICTYNGSTLIKKTLQALARQNINNFNFEIILVDNNSNDKTAEVAKNYWETLNSNFEFKIFTEPKAGKVNAIKTGIANCKNEIVLFVDDDNSLEENYTQKVFEFFKENNNVGIVGGVGKLPKTDVYKKLPDWWETLNIYFAVESKLTKSKYVSDVIGAGMGMRKTLYDKLIEDNFNFVLTGRKGKESVTSGSDYEICYAIQLLGYKVYHNTNLVFEHFINADRINLDYVEKLFVGFGKSRHYWHAYKGAVNGYKPNFVKVFLFCLALIIQSILKCITTFFNSNKFLMHKYKLKARVLIIKTMLATSPKKFNEFCNEIIKYKAQNKNFKI